MATSRADRIRLRVSRSPLYLRGRDLVFNSGRTIYWVQREDLARRYLRGEGIEIGALTAPLRTPSGVTVRYVDRLDRAGLIAQEAASLRAANIDPEDIVEIDFVADAERLDGIADDSVDFVIAIHVLEHLQDPVQGLKSLYRVVRSGGHVLIILPDGRLTFDRHREHTTVEHALADHELGPSRSRADHHLEWARDIEGMRGEPMHARAAEFDATDARHHFHVWELTGFVALLRALDLEWEIVHAQAYLTEFAIVLAVGQPRPAPAS
jgi:SAM-dependent methyltransferase